MANPVIPPRVRSDYSAIEWLQLPLFQKAQILLRDTQFIEFLKDAYPRSWREAADHPAPAEQVLTRLCHVNRLEDIDSDIKGETFFRVYLKAYENVRGGQA